MSRPQSRKGPLPSHNIVIFEQPKDGTAGGYSTTIGAAWPTKSGEGFNIKLKALPLDGILTMLPYKEKEKSE